jgi:hypothetical protein
MSVQHADRAHALLGASKAKQWLICTPSVRLEEHFEDKTSEHAALGTLAHELSELMISERLNLLSRSELKSRYDRIESDSLCSSELVIYVSSYVDYVIERVNAAYQTCADEVVLLEQRLDFSEWVRDGFGTGDVVIITDQTVEVIDLKYGIGVPVSAVENPQLKLYGLGAINAFGSLYGFDNVRLTIVQPRLDSISTWEIMVDDLLKWGDDYVHPRAQLAFEGKGEFVPGKHCQFCKAKAACRARADQNLELAKLDFKPPGYLELHELTDVLKQADLLKTWVSDVQKYALEAILNGKAIDGFKVAPGRSSRKYSDEQVVMSTLYDIGYATEEICKPIELVGIGELEKRIGKKKLNEYIGHLFIKTEGNPKLAEVNNDFI